MSRALAILAAVALALLSGCGAAVEQPAQQPVDPIGVVAEEVARVGRFLDTSHAVLSAVHRDAAERARAAAPDDEAKHAAIDAVHARMRPAWDAYERALAAYIALSATVRAAELTALAGRQPDAAQIAAAIIAMALACEALSSAAAAVGVPAIGGGS
ncbi:hypothetical protein [Sorangium sp. So ce1024]|uniref:hypothetical protein n=1 Tax=Sorangium sp. So ce1024 TaxID=3133327 RepID=UPI003F039108